MEIKIWGMRGRLDRKHNAPGPHKTRKLWAKSSIKRGTPDRIRVLAVTLSVTLGPASSNTIIVDQLVERLGRELPDTKFSVRDSCASP